MSTSTSRPKMKPSGPNKATFTLADVFAGCGGMTRGFIDSGSYDPIFAVEMDPDAVKTYRQNFGDHIHEGGIESVTEFPKVDVLIGGPPCQAFSLLNRESVGFVRRELWREYARALEQTEASVFVMENVPQLLESDEYQEFKRTAEELGYRVDQAVLNAADFGTPQTRRRAIAIGSRLGVPPWPQESHRDPQSKDDGRSEWRTFRDAVDGLPLRPNMKSWHRPRNPRPESIRRYKAVPRDGGNRFDMQRNLDRAGLGDLVPRCWRDKPTGTTDVFGRLWWDRPAFTIRTEFYKPEKGRYLHPSAHRPITLREAARCMGFEDDFILPEDQSMTSVARQIGNAVPPPLAAALAQALAEHLRTAEVKEDSPVPETELAAVV